MLLTQSTGFSLLEVLVSLILLSIALLGLDMMEVLAIHKNLNSYYANMAEQQLHNIEQRLSMLGDNGNIEQQVAMWNQENQVVLPQGRGVVQGAYPHYRLSLFWGGEGDNNGMLKGKHGGCITENFT